MAGQQGPIVRRAAWQVTKKSLDHRLRVIRNLWRVYREVELSDLFSKIICLVYRIDNG